MKKSLGKKSALLLALVLMLPFWWNQNVAVASAATPAFTKSKVEIVGGGETYQLEIKNKVTGSTYMWSSTNTKVAKVSSKGLVTTVGKGSTTIKCKIAYSKSKSTTISCKVYVTIPATDIKINNAVEVNGAHILLLGETFDFNRDIVPANSSDKTYWSIGGGDEECIRIDNPDIGIVTGLKAGKVILVATAAKTVNPEDLQKSIINDAIIIEVKTPSASVGSAEIINSTELRIVFDSQIDRTTVMDANNKLLSNISITTIKDTKGILSRDPGTLTAMLSDDKKTLTITSSNSFSGQYGINITGNIKTINGVAIVSYYKQLNFIDTMGPAIAAVSLDETGMIETIMFTEAIDFTGFKVINVSEVMNGQFTTTAEQSTISIIGNSLNYIVSTDKKSLSINLSKIAAGDLGKTFSIAIAGIKDMAGNIPANVTLTTYISTDKSQKPQARPITVARTSYNIITATFDRAIQIPGWATINGNPYIGTVDENNNKKVNFTISDSAALLSGLQVVGISSWNSYNVIPAELNLNQLRNYSVEFTTDKTTPVLIANVFDAETNTLTLTYNEEVVLSFNSGVFSAKLTTNTGVIQSGLNISYTKLDSTDSKIIKLKLSNMLTPGYYLFNLDLGFVKDNFKNLSFSNPINISNNSGTTTELPGPYAIRQSPTNPSLIYLDFANKLDIVSAQTATNYKIAGAIILSAQLTENTSNGAIVQLTVADGSMDYTIGRPVTITGLKDYNGSFSEISKYTAIQELKENTKPTALEPLVFDNISKKVIRMNFSEQIQGDLTVKVTQAGAVALEYTNKVVITDKSAYITLDNTPVKDTYLRIDVLVNNIKDMNGNTATINASTGVFVTY